jgi:hypothetical protein
LPELLLTPTIRRKLKQPLGKLITGSAETIVSTIRRQIKRNGPKRVICVGDAVSRLFNQHKLQSDVRIIDNVEMRRKLPPTKLEASGKIFFTKNKAGTVDMSSWCAVGEAIQAGNSMIVVDGEEDLLTLAAIAQVPVGSFVVYGQPKVGVVVVIVDRKIIREVESMLRSMRNPKE